MATRVKRRTVIGLLAVALVAACAGTPVAEPAPEAPYARLFLVRHGEKEAGADPALSLAGAQRAQALAARLGGEGVTQIWSTQTNRTRQTAAPLAAALGLEVLIYDASALAAFASALGDTPGVKLVVGHSNTTDALAALIGADPGPAIHEASEFDRMYVIDLSEDGVTADRIERYGASSRINAE
ncbi:histidine phosphatase family protein [Hyphomonas sp.]|jgi:probable phosphoglycerate mutase|uniref:histidine phosphatase family protein n=1 Tax=Hyphomonas sp. TaxID=87 RepID=UPI0025C6AF1E|nr:histidine phosphatase family protein [Hyphomonas sp.]